MKIWQWIFWILVFLAGCNSGHSETLIQVRNRIDTFLTNNFPTLVARQNTYFSTHNKFWQGLITHSAIPSHTGTITGDSVADDLLFHPTDQTESWLDILPEWSGTSFAAALVIDVYDGALGKGWIATLFVRYNGTTYYRAKGVGPEDWHDVSWTVYTPSD